VGVNDSVKVQYCSQSTKSRRNFSYCYRSKMMDQEFPVEKFNDILKEEFVRWKYSWTRIGYGCVYELIGLLGGQFRRWHEHKAGRNEMECLFALMPWSYNFMRSRSKFYDRWNLDSGIDFDSLNNGCPAHQASLPVHFVPCATSEAYHFLQGESPLPGIQRNES